MLTELRQLRVEHLLNHMVVFGLGPQLNELCWNLAGWWARPQFFELGLGGSNAPHEILLSALIVSRDIGHAAFIVGFGLGHLMIVTGLSLL